MGDGLIGIKPNPFHRSEPGNRNPRRQRLFRFETVPLSRQIVVDEFSQRVNIR